MRRLRFWFVSVCFLGTAWAQYPTGELNSELPKWLRFSGEYRMRLEDFWGIGFKDQEDSHVLNRVRLNLRVAPASWLKFVFQGQDARIWGNDARLVPSAPPYKNSMDLRMGYVELGDPENRPVSLRVGRQEFVYGEQRLIGHTSWSNTARTFDAVRATFRAHGWRVDAFVSSVVNIRDDEFDRPVAGNNFHGVYASNDKLISKSTLEAYALWRLQPRLRDENNALGNLNFGTFGTRWAGKLPANFDYGIEMAAQAGSLAGDSMRAWAGHWVLGHTLASRSWKPRFSVEYNYASGDKDPRDGRRGTFDSLYPTPHGKYGQADQVGWRNIHDLRFGGECKPRPKWTLASNFHTWWLASARDWLYNAAGNPLVRVADGSAGTHVGEEIDFEGVYALHKQVQVGLGVGHLFPGEFLKQATPGHTYTYPYILLNYTF